MAVCPDIDSELTDPSQFFDGHSIVWKRKFLFLSRLSSCPVLFGSNTHTLFWQVSQAQKQYANRQCDSLLHLPQSNRPLYRMGIVWNLCHHRYRPLLQTLVQTCKKLYQGTQELNGFLQLLKATTSIYAIYLVSLCLILTKPHFLVIYTDLSSIDLAC